MTRPASFRIVVSKKDTSSYGPINMFSRVIRNVAFANARLAPQLCKRALVAFPARNFSVSAINADPLKQLREVVNSEHKLATSVDNELLDELKDFLSKSGFEIIDKQYDSNVEMKRVLPTGEEVRVFFDIDEISDVSVPPSEFENEVERREDYEEEFAEYESTFAHVKVFVSKPETNDGLFFNLMLQNSDEEMFVEYFNYKPNASEFLEKARELGTFLRVTEYQGPQFSNLDSALQLAVEDYLQTLGVTSELTDFIFAYSEVKEEDAYRDLLGNVSKFLSK